MAAKNNVTTTGQFSTSVREVDFVTRFADNWDALRNIMGIMRPIRKALSWCLTKPALTVRCRAALLLPRVTRFLSPK